MVTASRQKNASPSERVQSVVSPADDLFHFFDSFKCIQDRMTRSPEMGFGDNYEELRANKSRKK